MIKIITEKMQEKNLSQNKLAELAGVSQQDISRVLLGDTKNPSFGLVVKIAKVLDIDLNQFK